MSHPIAPRDLRPARATRRPYAAVRVERTGGRPAVLTVVGPVRFVTLGTLLLELPAEVRVVDGEGAPVAPSGRYYITQDTCDPYHLLVDALESASPFEVPPVRAP